jgi:HK97 gp10 family phage protein
MADQSIIGGHELDAFLQQVSVKVEKNILRAALRAGANEFKEDARQQVPVDEGDLRRSIRVSTRAKKGTVYAYLKAGGRKAPHAHLVEFGTAAHKIMAKKGSALVVNGKAVRDVDHPGAKAKPFMRPSFDTGAQSALVAVGEKIRERLTKENINVPAPEGS